MQSSSAETLLDSRLDPSVTDHGVVSDPRKPKRRPTPILQVARTDLMFRFEADGMIDIRVRVTNPGPGMSPPRRGRIGQAAFGAFVPTTPLTAFRVPALAPGKSTVIELRVPRAALGGNRPPPDPPAKALRAVPIVPPEAAPPDKTRTARLARRIRAFMRGFLSDGDPSAEVTEPYLAGNLDVHIGPTEAERHLSGPLRICRGRPNLAMFFVGTGADAYRFHLLGEGAKWGPTLSRFDSGPGLGTPISPGTWYECSDGCEPVFLEFFPPAECRRGGLEVRVEQRSTGRIAHVEFDLDPNALEAGCYTV